MKKRRLYLDDDEGRQLFQQEATLAILCIKLNQAVRPMYTMRVRCGEAAHEDLRNYKARLFPPYAIPEGEFNLFGVTVVKDTALIQTEIVIETKTETPWVRT